MGVNILSIEKFVDNPLWEILVETVHNSVMYPHYKSYIQSVFLSEKPDTTPQDLTFHLNISLGEAMVILYELKKEKENKQ